ncbi:hypothetical protein DSO57_1029971 [Entomophthora muscae]|uniref:Uncharacterized protein n=1 Tax=Entomophthora muscae TaxID=34485 RepID=A0ACC2TCN4_9FUNG|nr:hypothetical protein DSO57_1029971 [Entomophthora muscae]
MALYFLKQTFYRKIRFEEKLGYDHSADIFEGPSGGGIFISLQGMQDPGIAEMSINKILNDFSVRLSLTPQPQPFRYRWKK